MARLTIYKDNHTDSTVVPNLFIDEYMKEANDAQLKVYLYLLRMMNAHQSTSVSDIADKFNHTEKDVVKALKFWEKNQLIDLDFDRNKALVGIHIRDLDEDGAEASDSSFIPLPGASVSGRAASQRYSEKEQGRAEIPVSEEASLREAFAAREEGPIQNSFNENSRDFRGETFTKPSYSADNLREFKNRENTAQLLFIAESYIGRPLSAAEMKTILFFTDGLHFSDDLIDYLLQYCVDRGKKDFKYIEKVAISWAERGIKTPEQAQSEGGRYSKEIYDIVKALGNSNMPTDAELDYITRWTVDYAFSQDIILEACRRTVLAVNSNRYKYADALLKNWHEQNVTNAGDIQKLDEAYHAKKKNAGTSAAPKQYVNRFNQFSQNSYDFDALEKKLLSN